VEGERVPRLRMSFWVVSSSGDAEFLLISEKVRENKRVERIFSG